jgi:hypothetical protein
MFLSILRASRINRNWLLPDKKILRMSGAIALKVAGDWWMPDWRRDEYEESGEARRPRGYLDFKAAGRLLMTSSYFEMLA